MANLHYPAPIYFVTVTGHPASQAVLRQLGDPLRKLRRDLSDTPSFITQATPDLLLQTLQQSIHPDLTVALFDVPNGLKHYKPLHRTQPDSSRPTWAVPPQWSIKINTDQATNDKMLRDCAQAIAAWFRRGIENAVPGLSYPWGPMPTHARHTTRQRLIQHLSP